ncbi:unnamed protein product [Trifolium pratense]|uniref:Uncharacterized protein n=1 Tax=Trifolium pratense TaxID=57577 RepID=A0ACB0MFY2_TRIPR|nr:unnamed protein product [Trifolium pratense]
MKLQSLSQSFNLSFTGSIYPFEAVDIGCSKASIPVPLVVSVVKLSLIVISYCINGHYKKSCTYPRLFYPGLFSVASPPHNLAVVLLLSEIVQIHALPRLTVVRK